jgi:hypothetical protein
MNIKKYLFIAFPIESNYVENVTCEAFEEEHTSYWQIT